MKSFALVLLAFIAYGQAPRQLSFSLATGTDRYPVMSVASPQNVAALDPNTFNCSTVFWTIDYNGAVRQWSLINGIISGGDTILTGGGGDLAYVQKQTPTIYSGNWTPFYLKKYTSQDGWMAVPYNNENTINFGGYGDDLYFMESDAKLVHYNIATGVANTVDTLVWPESFVGVADIAVDTAGRAWVFKNIADVGVTQLRIYGNNGLIATYPISFNPDYMYGSFFLNDNLYIGRGTNHTIVPVLFNGTSASLGASIPFQNNNYMDMASCNSAFQLSTITLKKAHITAYPNPTSGIVNLKTDLDIKSIEIYDFSGKKIISSSEQNSIDLSGLSNGLYLLKAEGGDSVYNEFIIKK
jgi:hypothetical protein